MPEQRIQGLRVLVVEDDTQLREAIQDTLELAGAVVTATAGGTDALRALATTHQDVVVSDVNMPGIDGHELLRRIRTLHPHLPVVMITAYATIARSVQAMREGAFDYLVKPFQPAQLLGVLERCIPGGTTTGLEEPVAVASSSVALFGLGRRVAATDSTVLICGESGTGKEVLARYIHRHSPRAARAFVAINCAAIPENMLEALLFGHEKGAFTGAYASMPGKFEQADGGTLLLDEISEMELGLQAKLLRVLQEREVERLGARRPLPVDVRVIATTNRELWQRVEQGRFREDLYYRLSVFPLVCPPLRERPEDILPLARRLLRMHAAKMQHCPAEFDTCTLAALHSHAWPGNVRELDNALQRALIMQPGALIAAQHLRLERSAQPVAMRPAMAVENTAAPAAGVDEDEAADGSLSGDLRLREFQVIVNTLRDTRGSRNNAAERLGISPRTLRYKLARMRESGLDVDAAVQG